MNRSSAIIHQWIAPGGDLSDAYNIRYEVFVDEQNVPREIEVDEFDPVSDHLVIYVDGKPAATGRIVWGEPVSLGRIAVRKEHRGTGLGAEVVNRLVDKVFASGAEEVHLHAQIQAAGFYEKLGFAAYGDPYEEAGIPHISMCKKRPGA